MCFRRTNALSVDLRVFGGPIRHLLLKWWIDSGCLQKLVLGCDEAWKRAICYSFSSFCHFLRTSCGLSASDARQSFWYRYTNRSWHSLVVRTQDSYPRGSEFVVALGVLQLHFIVINKILMFLTGAQLSCRRETCQCYIIGVISGESK